MAPPDDEHGKIAAIIAHTLHSFGVERCLGNVRAQSGFQLSWEPDTCRVPGMAFTPGAAWSGWVLKASTPVRRTWPSRSLAPGDAFREVQEHI